MTYHKGTVVQLPSEVLTRARMAKISELEKV